MIRSSLYHDDVVTWADQQVAELRRLARTAPSNTIDWDNVIEEIESVGRSETSKIESWLENALEHVLKGFCDPDSLSRLAWSVETETFLRQARKRFRPSMRRLLDIDDIWRDAFAAARTALDAYGVPIPPGIPADSPFTLDDLLAEGFGYDLAVRRLYDDVKKRRGASETDR